MVRVVLSSDRDLSTAFQGMNADESALPVDHTKGVLAVYKSHVTKKFESMIFPPSRGRPARSRSNSGRERSGIRG